MPALPVLSGAEVVRILQTKGWSIKRKKWRVERYAA
jgi:predicted RNA binding protein YcfA (HicA-like mRNA interferase family)